MTKLHGVRNHPFRRTLPRMPKISHILWILALGLLLLAVLTFWSHSAAAEMSGGEVHRSTDPGLIAMRPVAGSRRTGR